MAPDERDDETRLDADGARGSAEVTSSRGQVGPYRIVGILGEGGMGTVFEAEQASPRRRVALKVIRGRFADDTQVRMFLREAETLGRLEHPNIGAIYESGRTPEGQHYFAMELVRGQTLDAYLRARGSSIDRVEVDFRLRLCGVIADAVQYAHQRGVIHRDLKPSNILIAAPGTVSGMSSVALFPTVKVLDFGLARLADAEGGTTQTDVGLIKGTLAYMSPEQARGTSADVDARSDVYALGVVLYEMLTDRRPYDTQRGSLLDAVRVICEDAPTPLESAWPGPVKLDPDIATIIAKALEKDPARRYASAAAMADDVNRYRSAQPILARPPSAAYQIKRFAQRHRGLVGAVAAVLLAIVLGGVAAAWQAVRATHAEGLASRRANEAQAAQVAAERGREQANAASAIADEQRRQADAARAVADEQRRQADAARVAETSARDFAERRRLEAEAATASANTARIRETAERQRADASAASARDEAAKARAVNDFLTSDLLAAVMPSTKAGRGRDVPMREVLDEAARRIDDSAKPGGRFADQPLVEASIRLTLGRTYRILGEFDRAIPHLQRAISLRQSALGRGHLETGEAITELALVLQSQAKFTEAEPLLREGLAALEAQRVGALLVAKAQANLGTLLRDQRKWGEAEPLLRAASAAFDRDSSAPADQSGARSNLALLLMDMGRDAEAQALLEKARETLMATVGPAEPVTLMVSVNLGIVYRRLGRAEDAATLLEEVLPISRRVAGDNHPDTILAIVNLASIWNNRQRYADSEALARPALPTARAVFGNSHPATVALTAVLGEATLGLGRVEDAEALFRLAVAGFETIGLSDHAEGVDTRVFLAETLVRQMRWEESRTLLVAAIKSASALDGPDATRVQATSVQLASVHVATGSFAEAETLLTTAIAAFERPGTPPRSPLVNAYAFVARLRERQGRLLEALPATMKAIELSTSVHGPAHRNTIELQRLLGNRLVRAGRPNDAEPYLNIVLAARRAEYGAGHRLTLEPLFDLGNVYRATRRRAEANAVDKELVDGLVPLARRPDADVDTLARTSIILRTSSLPATRDAPLSVAFAERAAALSPSSTDVLSVLAFAQADAKQRDAAIATLEHLLTLLPASDSQRAAVEQRLKVLKGGK